MVHNLYTPVKVNGLLNYILKKPNIQVSDCRRILKIVERKKATLEYIVLFLNEVIKVRGIQKELKRNGKTSTFEEFKKELRL